VFRRDRRKAVRRQADREMMDQLDKLRRETDGKDGQDAVQQQFRQMRRRAIRHNCTVQIAVQVQSSGYMDTWDVSEFRIKGRVLDLSEEGCSIFVQHAMETGQALSLFLSLRDKEKVPAAGIIRWTRAMPEKGGIALGVQFVNLEDKPRKSILAFLKEVDRTMGL
jgi:hypothetical protein